MPSEKHFPDYRTVSEIVEPTQFWALLNGLPDYLQIALEEAKLKAVVNMQKEDHSSVLSRLRSIVDAYRYYGYMYMRRNRMPDLTRIGPRMLQKLRNNTAKASGAVNLESTSLSSSATTETNVLREKNGKTDRKHNECIKKGEEVSEELETDDFR